MSPRTPIPYLVALAACLLAGAAQAASRSTILTGTSLGIDSPCARQVDIQPDPGLHGQISITATADHQEELDRLVFDQHDGARIKTVPDGCWEMPENGQRTLGLTIKVPAGLNLTIEESGAARYTIGAVGGKLTMDLSGAVELRDQSAADATLDLSGAGSIWLGQVSGGATLSISGHGKATIDQAALHKLTVDLSGSGAVGIAHGSIGDASVDASGAGTINIGADTTNAAVDISGAASVHFAKVTGSMDKDVSGAGSVSVGN